MRDPAVAAGGALRALTGSLVGALVAHLVWDEVMLFVWRVMPS